MPQVSEYLQRYQYRPQRTLQTLALSSHERQKPIGYFSLPVEIRDVIMELALVVGDIQLQVSETDEKAKELGLLRSVPGQVLNEPDRPRRGHYLIFQPPGFKFLWTCKQACAEGYAMFFSKNTFYFPWGPVETTHKCFEQIGHEYRSMIQKVGLTLGLQDLTLADFDIVEKEIGDFRLYILANTYDERNRYVWAGSVMRHLRNIWDLKINYLWNLGPEMRNLKIGNSEEVFEFEGLSKWYDPGTWPWPKEVVEVRDLERCAALYVKTEVEEVVGRDGPEALKAMVF